jgi:hypothetical protein
VTLEKARKALQKCAAEGAERCEVAVSPKHDKITIERKIQIAK